MFTYCFMFVIYLLQELEQVTLDKKLYFTFIQKRSIEHGKRLFVFVNAYYFNYVG